MKNIEYIITAEFHIDKGPSLIHLYPEEIPGVRNLSFLPEIMIPDQIHKREEDFTLFLLFRDKSTGEFQYLYNKRTCELEPYYLYTIVHSLKDDTYKRGSRVKSISIITRLAYFKNFQPLLMICLDSYFRDNDVQYLKGLHDSINVKNLDIGNSMSIIKKLLITSILDLPINDKIYSDESFRNQLLELNGLDKNELFIRKDLSFNSIINFQNMNIPIKVPMLTLPDTIGDYLNPTDLNFKANLINLLSAKLVTELFNSDLTIYGLQTPPIIILINAMLIGKKIVFLSYDKSSGHIIDNILLMLKIITGGGILSGLLTNYNVFPILDVSKIELLEQCDSYIAGTINPFFKYNDKLWDILYDLDSNELFLSTNSSSPVSKENQFYKNSIISEDAKFLSNLQLSIFNYNDDLTTIQLIFRRHINEIIRILLSLKNFNRYLLPYKEDSSLLLEGIGYCWNSDTNKLLEMSCYQTISMKFQNLLYNGKIEYNLLLPNLTNEMNVTIDLQYHLQSLSSPNTLNEHEIWYNILKYLISGRTLEIFLLITYLIPPNSSTSLQSSATHGGSLTIFDKNKGIELLLMNLFNHDNGVKSIVIMILQELQDNFICGWCFDNFIKSNLIYEMAFDELLAIDQ